MPQKAVLGFQLGDIKAWLALSEQAIEPNQMLHAWRISLVHDLSRTTAVTSSCWHLHCFASRFTSKQLFT